MAEPGMTEGDGDGEHSEEVSDEALTALARSGDQDAFAELWRRHSSAGMVAARQFHSIADADDIVSEAYLQILRAIQRAGGPTGAFRPYLYRTIRNVALNWRPKATAVPLDLTPDIEDPKADTETTVLENTITVRAFRTLPERWQTVLWYTEVERMDPADAAPILGLTANGVAALAYRAREGLRKAWLQAHVNDRRVPEECRWTTERMGEYSRDGLAPTAKQRFDEHLRTCNRCLILLEEIDGLSGRLASVLLPAALGGAAGLGLLGELANPQAAQAAPAAPVEPPSSRAAGRPPGRGARLGATVLSAVALAGVLVTAAAASGWFPAEPAQAPGSDRSAAADEAEDGPAEAPSGRPATPDKGLDSELPESGSPDPLRDVPRTGSPRPLVPDSPVVPGTPVVPQPSPPPLPTIPPPPPVEPEEPAPADTVALPPVIDALPSGPAVWLPTITGSSEPGATVELRDDAGAVLGTAVADSAGLWRIPLPDPGRDGHSVTAIQTDLAGNVSEAAPLSAPIAFTRPTFDSPGDGAVIPSDGGTAAMVLALAGEAGLRVQVLIDGVPTGNIHTLETEPIQRTTQPLAIGTHTASVRYIDPETGDVGSVSTVSFTVAP